MALCEACHPILGTSVRSGVVVHLLGIPPRVVQGVGGGGIILGVRMDACKPGRTFNP